MYASGYGLGNQKHIHYLSNLISYAPAYLVFPAEGSPTLFVFIYPYVPAAVAMSVVEDVRWSFTVDGPVDRIRELGAENAKIGIVGEDNLSASILHDHFERLSSLLPKAEFEPFTPAMEQILKIPSDEELEWYRRGAKYTDLGAAAFAETVEPGKTDNEVYAAIQHACLSQPHAVFYFTWIGSTPMDSPMCPYPFVLPSGRMIQKGDVVLAEVSGSFHGYAGQIQRVATCGTPPSRYTDLFEISRDVYLEVQEILKPGNTPRDVYGVTEKFLRKGYSIQCPTIHGWGQRLIPPFASVPDDEVYCAQLDVPFEENQLIVIEPSPCAPDLSSGFFFGGLNRVSSSGGEALQQFPFELIVKN